MKILITGSKGMLGSQMLKQIQQDNKEIELMPTDIEDFDITNLDQACSYIFTFNPDTIIHCAAYTNVDGCESNKELAYKINALGAKNIAIASKVVNSSMVLLSTDYIFDGSKSNPYIETDIPNPINTYGKTKLVAEEFIKEEINNYYIVRTSWLYGESGSNFLKTILKLGKQNSEIKIINDQIGTPTYVKSLSRQILTIIKTESFGIYHSSCNGYCSWYEFACEIVKQAGLQTNIIPIRTEDYPLPATRPRYSVLDNYMLRLKNIDIMPNWKDSLINFFNENHHEDLV